MNQNSLFGTVVPLFKAGKEARNRGKVREDIIPWHDENGILYVGIEQFLLEENAVDI